MAYENKHWDEVPHNEQSIEWASYIELCPLVLPVITAEQRDAYVSELVEAPLPIVKRFNIRVAPDYFHLDMTQVVEAVDEEEALRKSAIAALGTLVLAGKNIDHLEFVTAHLTPDKKLYEDGLAAQAQNMNISIRDTEYRADPDLAHAVYVDSERMVAAFSSDLVAIASL